MNFYFRFSIWIDSLLAMVIVCLFIYFVEKNILVIPPNDQIVSLTTDISSVSLTSAGFVLTLLTVLITFKSSSRANKGSKVEDHNLFELFFATNLYTETIQILKYCVVSLLIIALLGYLSKLILQGDSIKNIYYFNVAAFVILFATLWRCLFILNQIIKFQTDSK